MQEVQELLERVAPTDANVLLLGESGVGKEVMANQIHRLSKRARRPAGEAELRGFPGEHDRGRAVRLREGRLHRRGRGFPAG